GGRRALALRPGHANHPLVAERQEERRLRRELGAALLSGVQGWMPGRHPRRPDRDLVFGHVTEVIGAEVQPHARIAGDDRLRPGVERTLVGDREWLLRKARAEESVHVAALDAEADDDDRPLREGLESHLTVMDGQGPKPI